MKRGLMLLALGACFAAAPLFADEPELSVDLACPSEAGSGRLVCRAQYRPAAGERLVWADALVVSTPSFARPLRARVLGTVDDDGKLARASLALVTAGQGRGELEVRSRAVVCRGADDSVCRAVSLLSKQAIVLP